MRSDDCRLKDMDEIKKIATRNQISTRRFPLSFAVFFWLSTLTIQAEDIPFSIAWSDLPHGSDYHMPASAEKLNFRVCSEGTCLEGTISPVSTVTLLLQLCGLERWSQKWEIGWIPWPSGAWIIVRHNDNVEDGIFVPWQPGPETTSTSNCTRAREIDIDNGTVVLELLVCDDVCEVVSEEIYIKLESDPLRIVTTISASWSPDEDREPEDGLPERATEELSRTMLCDLVVQYPLIRRNSALNTTRLALSKIQHRKTTSSDTLILYSFSHSEGWREDNLFFWLAQGLIPSNRYYFVVIVNGSLDSSWVALLNRLSALMKDSFEWVQRNDIGRDICSWESVLRGHVKLQRNIRSFERIMLMNGSVRGPFLTSFFTGDWPEIFLGRLSDEIKLTGVTINCQCSPLLDEELLKEGYRGLSCDSVAHLHIQSYLLGFERSLLDTVLEHQNESCWSMSPSDSHALQATKAGLFELGLTRAVRARGANIAVTQSLWRGADFRDEATALQLCRDSVPTASNSDPLFPDAYAGINAHPLELVYFKTNRGLDPEVVHVHTRMALASSPWSAPSSVFCA